MLAPHMTASEASSHPGTEENGPHFIEEIVLEDLRTGKNGGCLQTRFPPEPNGFLHIGHAKAIWINFTMAAKSPSGRCNLRLDDTNPAAEEDRYVQSIIEDVRWLGFEFGERLFFASDYFERLYECAVRLIKKGLAYVDSQTPDEIRETRGNFYIPGKDSPDRERSIDENLVLLAQMRAGQFREGEVVLRAKIDMAHPNMNMRDPLIYRIRKAEHHRTGDAWCIYPMYDFAHPLSDAFEGVTHSLCSLEFENHRPLYDWFVANVGGFTPVPRQIEFARLNITYTVLSKRKLQELVQTGEVHGWDDPRMPTIAGMRRRGYLPQSIVAFVERTGVAKRDNLIEIELFEHQIREDLNAEANRTMAVLRPLKVVLTNMAEGQSHTFEVPVHPEYPERGTRTVTLERNLFIESDDYLENPPKKWFRLTPGQEVRLRGACIIRCDEAVRDLDGNLTELRCTWDPNSQGGSAADGRKVRGTIHWIAPTDAVKAEVRLYDRLFAVPDPDSDERSYRECLSPTALVVVEGALIERSLAEGPAGTRFQFERLGYFTLDPDSTRSRPVLNRIVTLKDSWAKLAAT
jgi:glutaminyl-tRNA synthetase